MKIIENSLEGIKEAAEILTSNGIVAFPTETVYGLVVRHTPFSSFAGLWSDF